MTKHKTQIWCHTLTYWSLQAGQLSVPGSVDKKLEQLEEFRKSTALVNDLRGLLDEKDLPNSQVFQLLRKPRNYCKFLRVAQQKLAQKGPSS
jgi:hypothetical protein